MKTLLLALLLAVSAASAEELLKTTEFSKGKGGWQGPGTVVYLDANGQEQSLPGKDTTAVLRIKLTKNRWTILEHRIRFGREQFAASLRIDLQTSADFSPLAQSKEYAEEDFREGGEYGWSARVFTKAGLLIQLSENGGWSYRPKALRAASGWHTVTANFDRIKSKQNETLALCFPPGDGTVDLKSVSLESR
jgi:hypothetical protein